MKIDNQISDAATGDLSAQIATSIRDAIVSGALLVGDRLPSEAELSEQFGVSRATVREALKRLAAQNLIRTQRGATGGAFVNRLSFEESYGAQVTTSTLLLSMNAVRFDVACEARFALERACAPLAAARRHDAHLEAMKKELHRQKNATLSDEAWCTSDVAFHRALVDAAGNPVLSYQLAGAVEAMQPLMNMITFSDRSREQILEYHGNILAGLTSHNADKVDTNLAALADYTCTLGLNRASPRSSK